MCSTIALWNIVGKTKHLLAVSAVPLHRQFNADVGALVTLTVSHGGKHVGVQYRFTLVNEIYKTFDPARTCKVIFFAGALVFQANFYTIVQKAQLAQAFAQNLVMEVSVGLKNIQIRQKVDLSASLVGIPQYLHG